MNNNNSPLEYLFTFSIIFFTGVVSTIVLNKYIDKVKGDAKRSE
jgi:hypothetical protein